jgi:uncharacterized protein (TIGR00288 family)
MFLEPGANSDIVQHSNSPKHKHVRVEDLDHVIPYLSMNTGSENTGSERSLAVFLDFENLALGFQNSPVNAKFEIHKVLERMVEKGKILVKKAYADWGRFTPYKMQLHDAAFELVDIPKRIKTGKNSADIRMCVDAMDLCYSKEHIDTFIILSGDSDFSPLVSKLKENGKHVIGLATEGAASKLLIENCDEFIFYEELDQAGSKPPKLKRTISKEKQPVFQLLIESVSALMRENKDILHSSMVKQTMKRKKPDFNEGRYGYRAFGDLLEDAQKYGLVVLREDSRSGTYVISGFGKSSI